MKKVIFGLALIVASSFSVIASNNGQQISQAPAQAVCTINNACNNACMQNCAECPFEGLNLTDAQKTKLQELCQNTLNCDKNCKNAKQKAELSKEQKRELRKEQIAKRKDARKDYLKGVKEILTADQYTLFLENSYLNQNRGNFGKAPGMHAKKFDGKMKAQKKIVQKDKK